MEVTGRCVHCLRFADEITDDHVFPRSWYPDSTPSTVQHWTVPCCRPCNKELGKMESDLLARLGLCLDPKSEAAAGVAERALRSLGIDAGDLSEKERTHRENRRLKLKAEFLPARESLSAGAIPGLVNTSGSEYAIPIPWAGLSIMAEKIARGCEYKLKDKKYVEPPYAVRTCITDPDEMSPLFTSHRRDVDFGPGCQVRRVFANEDPNVVRYRILIWATVCFHVLLDHEDYFKTEFDPRMARTSGIDLEGKKGMRVPTYLREFKTDSDQ